MPTYFARATIDTFNWLLELGPDHQPHCIVLHPADDSVKRTHIHFVFESTCGQKAVRKLIRDASGLSAKMDISVKDFDPNANYPKYLLRNSNCKLLYTNPGSDIGKKLLEQSLIEFPSKPKTQNSSSGPKPCMMDRINTIYDILCQEQTSDYHQNFSSFASDMLRRYYKDHADHLIPGEGSINAFKSYVLHLWGLYIENHLPDGGTFKDRLRKNYARLLFGQTLVPSVVDAPCL